MKRIRVFISVVIVVALTAIPMVAQAGVEWTR